MIRMLEDLTGVKASEMPLFDPDTRSLFVSTEKLGFTGDPVIGEIGTVAVPEFGTKFVRKMLEETRPTTFAELVNISGLSHGTDVWLGNAQELIRHKNGRPFNRYLHQGRHHALPHLEGR
jgi:DNA polymerase-3 subunit alpha (Gram-positive type)